MSYSDEWKHLWDHRAHLLSRKADTFIDYAYKQASKYGLRGSRVAAARDAAALLAGLIEQHGGHAKLADHAERIVAFANETEHAGIVDIPRPTGAPIRHLEVCEKKAPWTVNLRDAHAIFQRVFDTYGERARRAEKNDGVDWKALSHAVRIGGQSLEFLRHGFITFPRPDAAHLLQVKRGELPYQAVSEKIEEQLEAIRAAALTSTLPDEPDLAWCDNFVVSVYGCAVLDQIPLGDMERKSA